MYLVFSTVCKILYKVLKYSSLTPPIINIMSSPKEQETSSLLPTTTDTTESTTANKAPVIAILYNVLTLGVWVYGLVVCRTVAAGKPLTGVCLEEATWINVCSIFGLLSFCPLITVSVVPQLKVWTEAVYGLVAMFLFVWLVYGCTVFMREAAADCPAEMHLFGYILAIMFVTVAGCMMCCTCVLMFSRDAD